MSYFSKFFTVYFKQALQGIKVYITTRFQLMSRLTIAMMSISSMAFFFFFLIKPILTIIQSAFMVDDTPSLSYISLLFNNSEFMFCVVNSFRLGLITTFFTTLIALPLALINSRFIYPSKQLITSLIIISMFTPPFVGSIGIKHLFSHYGTLNSLLMNVGCIQEPITFLSGTSIVPIVFIQVLHLYPIMYLNLFSTLSSIDPGLEEASISLGVSRFRRYKDILWPLARPGFFSGSILVFIWSFTDLGTPLMTNFNNLLSVSIFHQMGKLGAAPYGYVMVFFMVCVTTAFIILLKWLLSIDHRHRMLNKTYTKGTMARPKTWQLSIIYVALFILVFLSLIPHLGVLITSFAKSWCNTYLPGAYTYKAYTYLAYSSCLTGIKNSFFYASIATVINLIIGSFIAYVIAKKKVCFVGVIDAIVMLPMFLPGLVLGFGYILTYMNTSLDPGKNPTTLLIMAYAIRYIPYTVRACIAGLQQLNVSLEEASSVFGASPLRTFWQITMPAILPSILGSGLLAFSRTILEVSESLFLATKQAYYPISKVIYSLYCSHGDGPVKASALGVVTLILISFIVIIANRLLNKKAGSLFNASN